MRLADDETILHVRGEAIRLRPSLRAAMRLEQRHGFDRLLKGVAEGNVTLIGDIIREASTEATSFSTCLERHDGFPLGTTIAEIQPGLARFILILAGHDDVDDAQKPSSGPRISFADYHAKLFGIATGWLGWTPETAWNATPAEIIAAYQGRLDLLKSIFGSGEKPDSGITEYDDSYDVDGFQSLKALAATGGNRPV